MSEAGPQSTVLKSEESREIDKVFWAIVGLGNSYGSLRSASR